MNEAFLSPHWHRVAPLRPRLRPHLTVTRQRFLGRAWYVLHDSATGKTHRFTPPVYRVIGAMDGERTMDEIWKDLAESLGAEAPGQGEIVTLLSQLHAADLFQSDVASDPKELFRRHAAQRRRETLARYLNPVSIRIPLLDPDRLLKATLLLFRPLISVWGVIAWAALVACALAALAPHMRELTGNLSDRVLSAQGLLLLACVFPVIKLVHELAHAYTIKAGGGEVHEMGVILIALFPTPYVEGSASSAFRSKWRRAGVAAAGMIAETGLAALAAFLWIEVEPGLVRALLFNVMLVAGVSTLVFNLNPLMRLDGYYIFSDLIEVPNLAQRASRFWGWLAEHYLFGADIEAPQSTPVERAWFTLYAPAAFAYRLSVTFALSLFLAERWFVLGVVIALAGVAFAVVVPLAKAFWHVLASPRLHRVRTRALAVTGGGTAALAAFLGLVPLPLHTTTEGVLWLSDDAYLRAGANGVVSALRVAPGSAVKPGDLVMASEAPQLVADVKVQTAMVEALQARYQSEQFADRTKAEVTRQELAGKLETLRGAREKAAALDVRAAVPGLLEAPRAESLIGRYVKRGEILGYVIGGPARQVRVIVPQADIDLVNRGLVSAVALMPGELWRPRPMKLARQAPAASKTLPSRALAVDGGGRAQIDNRDPKTSKTLERWFQLDFELEQPVEGRFGSRVFVRFEHPAEPLGRQLWRRGRQLFLSRLTS